MTVIDAFTILWLLIIVEVDVNIFEFADRNAWMVALYLFIIGYFLSQSFRKKYPDNPFIMGARLIIMVIPLIKQWLKSNKNESGDKNGKN